MAESMSRLNRDRYRKKLHKLLSRSNVEKFVQMVWAIDALQSGRAEAASRCIRFPAEAATDDITSKFAVHKWDLETLVCQLLITPKDRLREGRNRHTNCSLFNAGATAVNHLRALENAESGIYLRRFSILNEMHRIGQRQFLTCGALLITALIRLSRETMGEV